MLNLLLFAEQNAFSYIPRSHWE